jgi:ABC-type lipoprotein export system ATPase subunit
MTTIIELDAVTKEYPMPAGAVHALKQVSLTFEEGEFTSIVGSSGSGKSTLLYLMGLLISPTGGAYRFLDQPVQTLSDKARSALRGREIGFVFQSFHLVPQLTVVKNVLMGTRYRGNGAAHNGGLAQKAVEILERVGLSHRLGHKPGELSNGEMQRVAIARALLGDPRVILADEPTGNLDEENGDEIFKILETMHKEGKTIIMVTHDLQLAARTPRTVTLRDGEVIS